LETALDARLLHAARLFGAAQAVRDHLGIIRHPHEQPEHEAWIAALRQSLGDARFTAEWEAGRALSWEVAISCALAGMVEEAAPR
jgi:hypothetical protein